MIAPRGLLRKPTAKIRKEAITPETGDKVGKKIRGKTNAAAVPKSKKSYDSIVVPIALAVMIRTKEEDLCGCALIGLLLPPGRGGQNSFKHTSLKRLSHLR